MTAPARPARPVRSLFWTLTGTLFLVLLAAGILHTLFVALFFDPILERWNDERAQVVAENLARQIEALPDSARRGELPLLVRAASRDPGGVRYAFVDSASGRVMGGRMPRALRQEISRAPVGPLARPFGRDPLRPQDPGEPPPPPDDPEAAHRAALGVRIIAREPVRDASGQRVGDLVAVGFRPRVPFWPGAMSRRLLVFLPVTLLLAGVSGLLIFRMIARRLEKLERLATQVAEGRLDVRVTDAGHDEIGRLGSRLNEMTARLEEARRHQENEELVRRQLLADISHELATPLTSIRAQAETLLEPAVGLGPDERLAYLRGILDDADRMSRLTQDLLDLTRLEVGAIPLEPVALDLASLARNMEARWRSRFEAAGLALRWTGADAPAPARLDGRRMEQVIENLLTNSLRYVPAGGTVELNLETRPATETAPDGLLRLTVADDGPGIPPADLARVFDRFFRGDASRSTPGTGLGLAIVREIVHRHGGQVGARARSPRGTVFVIDLPAAPPG